MRGIFDILYEDKDFLIVNKLSAVPVLPDRDGDSSLKDFVNHIRPGKFVEPVHRIDRRTSGAVVFAKNKQSYAVLSEAFRDSRVHKVYWAVTENQPEDEGGTVQHRIHHNYKSNVSRIVKSEKSDIGSLVKMSYQVIGKSDRYHLLEVKPHSGKTHQIRIQLSAMSCPVRGDLKYGARRSTQNGFIMLHARAISFEFPENKKITVHAEPPHDEPLWKAFNPAASSFSFS